MPGTFTYEFRWDLVGLRFTQEVRSKNRIKAWGNSETERRKGLRGFWVLRVCCGGYGIQGCSS